MCIQYGQPVPVLPVGCDTGVLLIPILRCRYDYSIRFTLNLTIFNGRRCKTPLPVGPYKPRTGRTVNTGRTGQCMNYEHAPAILATPAIYCIHGRIIHQARGRQTVPNVNEKHAPSPSAATANTPRPSNCSNF